VRILVTGSAGHLGEALVRTLRAQGHDVVGLDLLPSPWTTVVGSVADAEVVRRAVDGVQAVLHTATLHKPHVVTHRRQDFVDTNVAGTLALLERSAAEGVRAFVLTSTTSTFGRALTPARGEPAAWVTEDVVPVPRNVYGVTKTAAEDLAELVARDEGLPVVVLRTSRFFPEDDDAADVRARFGRLNAQVNELLNRRVDLADVVQAHVRGVERAPALGFGLYVVSATTPFSPGDLAQLRTDAPAVVRRLFPHVDEVYGRPGWRLPAALDRVYVNARARTDLGLAPEHSFRSALDALAAGEDPRSALAREVGTKGYHATRTGPDTVR
jgi:UDP-glucose 4-epimerase